MQFGPRWGTTHCHPIAPARRNTFSYANRTRDPVVAERFYWALRDRFANATPGFRRTGNRGALAKFKTRQIFAIDSSVIPLSLNCIDWARYIHQKSAAKLHTRTNVADMLPSFVTIGSGVENDRAKAPTLCKDLHAGDIVLADRGYFSFPLFNDLDTRGITFVTRQRENLKCVVKQTKPTEDLKAGILADEIVVLAKWKARKLYDKPFRRIRAMVEVCGQERELVFVTNNFSWSARTIADLYKARWAIEILFKELKQTLQIQSFYGTNEKAVRWQIWSALIVHLVLRYLRFLSQWNGSYTRFVGIVRTAIWLKKDFASLLAAYGTAPPILGTQREQNVPYLPGFEKAYLKAMGQQVA